MNIRQIYEYITICSHLLIYDNYECITILSLQLGYQNSNILPPDRYLTEDLPHQRRASGVSSSRARSHFWQYIPLYRPCLSKLCYDSNDRNTVKSWMITPMLNRQTFHDNASKMIKYIYRNFNSNILFLYLI